MEKAIARTGEQGARQLLWAALGPDGKEGDHVKHMKGAFVMTAAVKEPSDFVISKEGKQTQDKIWVSRPGRLSAKFAIRSRQTDQLRLFRKRLLIFSPLLLPRFGILLTSTLGQLRECNSNLKKGRFGACQPHSRDAWRHNRRPVMA